MALEFNVNRRRFLRETALAGTGILLAGDAEAQGRRAKVVVVTCSSAITEDDQEDPNAVRRMVEKGVTTLSGKSAVADAWGSLIRRSDKVALVDSGTWLLNVPAVPVEVLRGLASARPEKLEFTYCSLANSKTQYLDALRRGLDRVQVPRSTMNGGIYTIPGKFHQQGYSVIVMTPTLKSHSIAGVSGVVKHYATMGREHVKNYHANGMETAGKVLGEEFNRHRHLIVVDALRWGAQRTGPAYYQKALLLGTDPVAVDTVALQLFLEHLTTGDNIPPDRHRRLADTRYHAGISEAGRIDVVRVSV